MSGHFDLGGHVRPVTTGSAQAWTWFTRGLEWSGAPGVLHMYIHRMEMPARLSATES